MLKLTIENNLVTRITKFLLSTQKSMCLYQICFHTPCHSECILWKPRLIRYVFMIFKRSSNQTSNSRNIIQKKTEIRKSLNRSSKYYIRQIFIQKGNFSVSNDFVFCVHKSNTTPDNSLNCLTLIGICSCRQNTTVFDLKL